MAKTLIYQGFWLIVYIATLPCNCVTGQLSESSLYNYVTT